MLFNECEPIIRDGQRIFLAGVDDPHFYRADDIEKAASQIPSDAFSILLAHTPEVYDRAMNARFDLVLCGHCACRKSNPNILVMQPAQDWKAKNTPCSLNRA